MTSARRRRQQIRLARHNFKTRSILRLKPPTPSDPPTPLPETPSPQKPKKRRRSTSTPVVDASPPPKSSPDKTPQTPQSPPSQLPASQPFTHPDRLKRIPDPSLPPWYDLTPLRLQHYFVLHSGVVDDRHYALLKVKSPGQALRGSAWISVLAGAIYIHGAVLRPSSPPILFQSLYESLLVSPHSSDTPDVPATKGKLNYSAAVHPDAEHHKHLRRFLQDSFVQHFENAQDDTIVFVTEVNSSSTTNSLCQDFPYTYLSHHPQSAEYSFPVINFLRLHGRENPHYHAVPEFLRQASTFPKRLVITGASKAGKSTLARSVVNHFVTTCGKDGTLGCVIYVDVDVGVPDRSPLGIISAHEVSEVSLTRQTACRSVPFAARFFGHVTPREDPKLYMRCVRAVVMAARERASLLGVPIVVNTHGWTTGVGEELLYDLCAAAEPTMVVRVAGGSNMEAARSSGMALDRLEERLPPHVAMRSVRGRDPGLALRGDGPTSNGEREITLSAYFSQEFWTGRTLRVAVRDVEVVTMGVELELSAGVAMQALVGTTVAVGRRVQKQQQQLQTEVQADAVDVKGLAVVRAVDEDGDHVFVATPVPTEVLQQCGVLVASSGADTSDTLVRARGTKRRAEAVEKGEVTPSCPFWMRGGIAMGASMRQRKTIKVDGQRFG